MRPSAPRARRLLALPLAALLALVACGDPTGPGAELRDARRRWATARPAAYRMTIEWSCFCGLRGPVEVVVRDGVVHGRRIVATGEQLFGADYENVYPPVEGLFALVDEAIERDADWVEATYDPERGYPVEIAIDHRGDVADDEYFVRVRDFAAP